MDRQPSPPASPFSRELGESEIMDMKVRGLLPVLSASNVSVPSLEKETKRKKLDGFVSERSPVLVSVGSPPPLQNPVILIWDIENRARFKNTLASSEFCRWP